MTKTEWECLRVAEAARRHNNPAMWAALFVAAWICVSGVFFKHFWIDLRSIEVSIAVGLAPPSVDIERVIHRRFWGSYSNTVRTDKDEFVCQTSAQSPFYYSPQPFEQINRDLGWWLAGTGGATAWGRCLAAAPAGTKVFWVETCHMAVGPFGIILARRCVGSNRFEWSGFDTGPTHSLF